jgi:mannose-6-phosphate isomerase-like protein (cupin superfamily)
MVLGGRARMRLGDEERDVGPGSLLYVSATTEHSFFEIEEDMTLLVIFATSPRT